MARQLYQPHDNLFRKVFADATEAAGLLRPNLPKWLSTTLDWSTLTLQDRSYVDEALEASQSDLLFKVQRQAGGHGRGARRAGAALVVRTVRASIDAEPLDEVSVAGVLLPHLGGCPAR